MPRHRRHPRRPPATAPLGRVVLASTVVMLLAVALFLWARSRRGTPRSATLPPAAARLVDLHAPLPPASGNDWRLGPGSDERGQSYEQWRDSDPRTARGRRKVLYVVLIGEVDEARTRIVDQAVTFLGLYFGLEVQRLPDIAVDGSWPEDERRRFDGRTQLRTDHILDRLLQPLLPADGAALLGLTTYGLWPGRGWNFVFGQASLRRRVGVWSIARFGDPSRSEASRVLCLRRTLKVATHETGHMFGIEHCLAYACNMCGSNHMEETDRHPLWLCPECLPKIWDATGVDPVARFERLARFARDAGLEEEAAFYAASSKRLQQGR